MQSTFDLRNAIAEDEGFVLRLEELSLRKFSDMRHFVPRPGMGDEFPGNCRIIRYENADVGCLTVSEENDCTHIDQLYLVPQARGLGIGRRVAGYLFSQAEKRGQRVQVTILANCDAAGFFLAVGFHMVSRTSMTIKMEWSAKTQAGMTGGITNV